jgi:hypothetical protein
VLIFVLITFWLCYLNQTGPHAGGRATRGSTLRKSAGRAIGHRGGVGSLGAAGLAPTAQVQARAELAGYIAQMTSELVQMASSARLDLLAHFLAMARIEAELAARDTPLDDV